MIGRLAGGDLVPGRGPPPMAHACPRTLRLRPNAMTSIMTIEARMPVPRSRFLRALPLDLPLAARAMSGLVDAAKEPTGVGRLRMSLWMPTLIPTTTCLLGVPNDGSI